MTLVITKSDKTDKRYKAVFDGKKTIHFGSKGGSTFLEHKDEAKKKAYLARHKVNEDWTTPYNAGSLSRWILWNKKSFTESVNDFKKRFNL
jgi:hypothetical protein